jgi:hypothetical protein
MYSHAMRTGLEKLNEEQLASFKAELFKKLKKEYKPDGFPENFEVFYILASR